MEKENQKKARQYNESLSEGFMTTKEIAKLWNQEVVDKDGKKRIRVPRKNGRTQGKQWKPSDISDLFERILTTWGLSESIDWYRSDKFFDLKENMKFLEDSFKKAWDLMQCDIESLMRKKEVDKFNELKKKLEGEIAELDKLIKNNCPLKVKKGDYIFSIFAFCIDEEEKDKDKGYDDPLYHIYRLYNKEEKFTKENIEAVADDLVKLNPIFKSILSLEKFVSCVEKGLELRESEYMRFYVRREAELEWKKDWIQKKLYQYLAKKNESWRISDILCKRGICDISKSEISEAWRRYRVILVITDYVAEKYIYLLETIDKTRKIEKEILYDNNEFSGLSISRIKDAYWKDFTYKMDTEMRNRIKGVTDKGDTDIELNEISVKFAHSIENKNYISEEEKGIIYSNFYDEVEELRDEGLIYCKLQRLMDEDDSIKMEDVERYFKITNEMGMSKSVVKIEQKYLELKIMEKKQLIDEIQCVIK